MNRVFYGILFSTFLLCACEEKSVSSTSVYDCKNQTIQATFTDGQQVTVVMGEGEAEKSETLNRIESDSGAKYASEDETVIFWSKGREANYIPAKGMNPLLCMRR